MLDKIVPLKIKYFFELIRFSKPVGFMLLMWPSWFALTLVPSNSINLIKWYIFFFIGAFLMRSAGCIINDLIDINIDKNIARTAIRPLTSNKISKNEAIIFLFLLFLLSFVILIQFNLFAILIGISSIPLVVLYPFMKRYTYWPQLILGIVFSWGVIIVSFQFLNNFNLNFIILYFGCIFWTLAYDTIYAYQDREEDIVNNIKSTAVLLGDKGLKYIKIFYLIFFSTIGYLSWKTSHNIYSLAIVIIFLFGMNIILNKLNIKSIKSSNFYFQLNNLIGLCCFIFLLTF